MRPKIFGHRGYPARFPENSLAGFRYAVEHGIDAVETDVQRTADGELIIMHDEFIDRTTNGHGAIKDYTLAELQGFHLANGEPVPTFKQFLQTVVDSSSMLDVEFKTTYFRYPGIEAQTQQLIEQFSLAEKTVYCCFGVDSLNTIAGLAPRMERCFLTGGDTLSAWGEARKITDVLHPDRYFSDLDIPQRVWTVDDPWEMRKLSKANNVIGLITDNFEQAKDIVDIEYSEAK